jgi:hypothetical protein
MYTHSIGWALHGKAVTKRNRSTALLGNELDQAARNCNDQQTNGIPIGPDTSLVISEIILSAVDAAVLQECPTVRVVRKLDDYEISANNQEEATEYLTCLQDCLHAVNLTLNQQKVQILELPVCVTPRWLRDLRGLPDTKTPAAQQRALIAFFDNVFEAAKTHPDGHVISYAIASLRDVRIDAACWEVFQSLLAQAVVSEPGTIKPVCWLLAEWIGVGRTPNMGLVSDLVHQVITQQAPHRHASEIAWALRLAIQCSVHLDEDATDALVRMDDDVVACLTLDANRRKMLTRFSAPAAWTSVLNEDGLIGPHWLLAYEANVKGWLPTRLDYVAKSPGFSFLKANGVGFYGISVDNLTTKLKRAVKRRRSLKATANSGSRSSSWTPPPIDMMDCYM